MAKRDEPGFFDGVIINDELDAAYAQLTGAFHGPPENERMIVI
jgi:hypothetical protein